MFGEAKYYDASKIKEYFANYFTFQNIIEFIYVSKLIVTRHWRNSVAAVMNFE